MGEILQPLKCLNGPRSNLQYYKNKQANINNNKTNKQRQGTNTPIWKEMQSSQRGQDKKANQGRLLKYSRITHFDPGQLKEEHMREGKPSFHLAHENTIFTAAEMADHSHYQRLQSVPKWIFANKCTKFILGFLRKGLV